MRVGDFQYAMSHGPLKQTHPALASASAVLSAARAVSIHSSTVDNVCSSEYGNCAAIRY